MTKQPLPDHDHVLRHVNARSFDGRVLGEAFVSTPRNEDDGLSVNWIEIAGGATLEHKIEYIRSKRRHEWKKSHRLAKLNVGRIRTTVPILARQYGLMVTAIAIHDPLDEDLAKNKPSDPTHSLIMGLSNGGAAVEEAVRDILANCVEEHFPALL